MNQLPVIPTPGASIALQDVIAIEEAIAHQVMEIENIEMLEEMRAKAAALAQYLKGKELHGPMLGAQRRVEARIGQLLGDGDAAQKTGKPSPFTEKVSSADKARFRVLARGLQFGLPDETWRSPRESLVRLIQERYPMPRHVPPIVETSDGAVRKPRAERAREIKELAECGALATQIAETLGIGEQQVRNIAHAEQIILPEAALGKRRHIDPRRVVESVVTGLEGSAISLRTIGKNLSGVGREEARIWAHSLADSISNLKRLRSALLEIANARDNSTDGTEVGTERDSAREDQDPATRAA